LTGKLIGAPHMKKSEIDLADCRLPKLRTAEWRGWIFINFSEQAMPFEQYIASMSRHSGS